MLKTFQLSLLLLAFNFTFAQDKDTYQEPPQVIKEIVLARPTPQANITQKADWVLLMERNEFLTVEELAQPELRIAGMRWNPKNAGPSRSSGLGAIYLQEVASGKKYEIAGLPENLRAYDVSWNPDESAFAFLNSTTNGQDLYKVALTDKKAVKINSRPINAVMGNAYSWAGKDALVYKVVPSGAGEMPSAPNAPTGPVIQESAGKTGASRTYQDLIKNPYDEALFSYFGTVQLVHHDGSTEKNIGNPVLLRSFSLSPDKKFLLITTIRQPFSYLVPASGFPHTVCIWNMEGKEISTIAENPSSEGAPIGFDDVADFPRNFSWRSDKPAELVYVKALDKGLGKSPAAYRDAVYTIDVANNGQPKELVRTKLRFAGITWGNDQLALLNERYSTTRTIRMNKLNPSSGKLDSVYQRRMDDSYADIGSPLTVPNAYGRDVLLVLKNGNLILRSQGASPDGDLPFISAFNVNTGKSKQLWRCQAPFYENVVAAIDAEKGLYLTVRESQQDVPNYYIRDLRKKSLMGKPITFFTNPYPMLEGISKEKISYKRKDGIDLTGDLYLPKGYRPGIDAPLPTIIWAYPREYKSASDAAQVRGSKYTFTRIGYGSPIYWVTQGFAVLDNAEMPIVGEKGKEPNDNFVEQLQLNAEAAIGKLADMKVGDPQRMAVGGHSYGAFMTANLLAHTNLFKAGIARSGAYNRTLTPFGFQNEERTYWQNPEVYFRMSPFSYANKIKTPILMIHGEADNNPGTFPIQSERLFNAIKGHGGTARLVFLPYESHGYSARENILHMLWEQDQWLKKHLLQNKQPF